jgi:hypothetical protein
VVFRAMESILTAESSVQESHEEDVATRWTKDELSQRDSRAGM